MKSLKVLIYALILVVFVVACNLTNILLSSHAPGSGSEENGGSENGAEMNENDQATLNQAVIDEGNTAAADLSTKEFAATGTAYWIKLATDVEATEEAAVPPKIDSIDFPDEISGNGVEAQGSIWVSDQNGDFGDPAGRSRCQFWHTSGNFTDFNLTPVLTSGNFKQGQYPFTIQCYGNQKVTIDVYCYDDEQLMSNKMTFSFTCKGRFTY